MRTPFLQALQVLLLTALAVSLIPAGAHLFEMAGKLNLSAEAYMQVQTIYAGWALFGISIFLSLVLLALHAWLLRHDRRAMWLSLLALALIGLTQVIFWTYTQPMNALTENWTVAPPDISAARAQWEYSHAVNAVLTFAAFLAGAASVVLSRRQMRLPDLRSGRDGTAAG
jgi:hypothetical protein